MEINKKYNEMGKMKAIVYKEYGEPDVLQIVDLVKPLPKQNEVCIRVKAVSINFGDLLARNYKNISPKNFNMPFLFWIIAKISFGFSKPRINVLGNSFSGEIESVGNAVTLFKTGDKVFGYTGEKMGAYANYLCMPENGFLEILPSNIAYDEASIIPYGTSIALNLLRKANIQKGQKVLIVGASGGIGSAAVQLAKHLFEAEVTGVCSSKKTEFVKMLGADKVIDYQKEDFTKNKDKYDLIFDILGKGTLKHYKNSLKENGIYLLASFKMKKLLQMLWTSLRGRKRLICALVSPKIEDLHYIAKLIEEGKIKSIVNKSYPLEQTAEAHRYIENRKNSGNVVIIV